MPSKFSNESFLKVHMTSVLNTLINISYSGILTCCEGMTGRLQADRIFLLFFFVDFSFSSLSSFLFINIFFIFRYFGFGELGWGIVKTVYPLSPDTCPMLKKTHTTEVSKLTSVPLWVSKVNVSVFCYLSFLHSCKPLTFYANTIITANLSPSLFSLF